MRGIDSILSILSLSDKILVMIWATPTFRLAISLLRDEQVNQTIAN